jgi:hypothetical protein
MKLIKFPCWLLRDASYRDIYIALALERAKRLKREKSMYNVHCSLPRLSSIRARLFCPLPEGQPR